MGVWQVEAGGGPSGRDVATHLPNRHSEREQTNIFRTILLFVAAAAAVSRSRPPRPPTSEVPPLAIKTSLTTTGAVVSKPSAGNEFRPDVFLALGGFCCLIINLEQRRRRGNTGRVNGQVPVSFDGAGWGGEVYEGVPLSAGKKEKSW